jgi:hypothetical protein
MLRAAPRQPAAAGKIVAEGPLAGRKAFVTDGDSDRIMAPSAASCLSAPICERGVRGLGSASPGPSAKAEFFSWAWTSFNSRGDGTPNAFAEFLS